MLSRESMAPVFVLAQLETLANGVIDNAPATRLKLESLAGRVAHLKVTAPRLDVYVHIDGPGIRLSHTCEVPVNLMLEGNAPALLAQFLRGQQFRTGGDVRIEGDAALALTLAAIARELDFDWEDLLSRHLGDVAAHQIGQTLRAGSRFLRDFARKAVRNSRAYLVEEKPMLVDRPRFDGFRDDVHRLRQDTERLEARIALLQRQLQSGA